MVHKYLEYKNLLVPTESLVKLDNSEPFAGSMTGTWGKIEQIYEEVDAITGRTWLKLVWGHPNKRFEKPEDFVTGLTIDTLDDTAGQMSITLKGSDMSTEQQLFWLEPLASGATSPWPDPGEDILVENKETKTWYYFKLKADPVVAHGNDEAFYIDEAGTPSVVGDYHHTDDTVKLYVEDSDAIEVLLRNKVGFKLYAASAANVQKEEGSIVGSTYVVTESPAFVAEPDVFSYVDGVGTASETVPNYFIAYKYSKVYEYYENNALAPGDQVYFETNDTTKVWYLDYEILKDSDGITALKVKAYDTYVDGVFGFYDTLPAGFTHGYGILSTSSQPRTDEYAGAVADLYVYGYSDQLYDQIEIVDHSWNAYLTTFQVKPINATSIEVGQFIVSKITSPLGDESYKLTKVLSKRKIYSALVTGYVYEYTVNQPIYIETIDALTYVTRYVPIDDFISTYQLFYLDGFKMTSYHLPGGTNKAAQLEKILGVLDPANTNLQMVLKDRDIITFRYVVDTFDGGLAQNTYPKTYLTRLAMNRQKCLAIMNAPSIKEFMISNDPKFTEEPTIVDPIPILQTRYIADGGNLSLGPSYTFSLPDELNGSKFCGYFAPFLVLRENGKNILVPPAAHVSNLFVLKFIKGQPYAIVAGTKRGVISDPKLVGVEYDFLLEDREYLEPFGFNPIIKKKGMGYVIYANQMAYQKTKSAFNNIHVRDLLITIEEAIEDLLANYLFDFNTASTRLEIKTRVSTYLEGVRSNDGIYDFKVIMDESNNTPEIIDQNFGIIDVAIEPVRGFQKFINKITVLRTGAILSDGFSVSQ